MSSESHFAEILIQLSRLATGNFPVLVMKYHTPIVFRRQSFLLPLMPNNKSVLVINLDDYLRNMMTHLARILVYSTDS
jgi:hypothetical protein